jgi:putative PIN family toxin of toxin-antitoxin system
MHNKVVLDTNIIVSAAISSKGIPSKITSLVSGGELTLFYSKEILEEYDRVLSYDRLDIPEPIKNKILSGIQSEGTMVNPKVSDFPMPDESDRFFYDAAKHTGSILITGNMKHYPSEDFIMTPADFFERRFT